VEPALVCAGTATGRIRRIGCGNRGIVAHRACTSAARPFRPRPREPCPGGSHPHESV